MGKTSRQKARGLSSGQTTERPIGLQALLPRRSRRVRPHQRGISSAKLLPMMQAGWLSARPPAPPSDRSRRTYNGAGFAPAGAPKCFPQANPSAPPALPRIPPTLPQTTGPSPLPPLPLPFSLSRKETPLCPLPLIPSSASLSFEKPTPFPRIQQSKQ